ncbi:MAG: hypothetical protein ACYTEL_16845 [Planctomycetota bacterium]
MRTRITKMAAAAVIIIALVWALTLLETDAGSVAFGEVLGYIQTSSYSFDLSVETALEGQDSTALTMQAMVWELGWMRVDCSARAVGKISSITDFNAGKTLLLFHENKAGVIKEESVLNKNTGAKGIVAFCTKPIEDLWNLRDGTEEQLGEKRTNGHTLTGFRVSQKDQYFVYDVTVWAHSENGVPSLVEVMAKPLDESYPSIKWAMNNFDLDVELDGELFSLELPAGYTLAYESDLDELEVETEPSAEAEKIVQMLKLWSEGRKNEAVQLLLAVNWAQAIEFGKEPYLFSITEKGYVALKADDQNRAIEEIMATAVEVRQIVYEVLDLGQAAAAAQDYDRAERHFEAALQLGRLLARDPESMIIVRLVGIAVEKKTLNEMISFYTTMNDQEKLQAVENEFKLAEAEAEKIKKKVIGQ